jgi:hypothetical protein
MKRLFLADFTKCMNICIRFGYLNITFVKPIQVSYFKPIFISDFWGRKARQLA